MRYPLRISENTFNLFLKRMGFKDRFTGHGIRATLSAALNELDYNKDWIEAQLSHSDNDKIRRGAASFLSSPASGRGR